MNSDEFRHLIFLIRKRLSYVVDDGVYDDHEFQSNKRFHVVHLNKVEGYFKILGGEIELSVSESMSNAIGEFYKGSEYMSSVRVVYEAICSIDEQSN